MNRKKLVRKARKFMRNNLPAYSNWRYTGYGITEEQLVDFVMSVIPGMGTIEINKGCPIHGACEKNILPQSDIQKKIFDFSKFTCKYFGKEKRGFILNEYSGCRLIFYDSILTIRVPFLDGTFFIDYEYLKKLNITDFKFVDEKIEPEPDLLKCDGWEFECKYHGLNRTGKISIFKNSIIFSFDYNPASLIGYIPFKISNFKFSYLADYSGITDFRLLSKKVKPEFNVTGYKNRTGSKEKLGINCTACANIKECKNFKTNKMKTQTLEEILHGYVNFKDANGSKTVKILPLSIIDAMEEYHNQFKKPITDIFTADLLKEFWDRFGSPDKTTKVSGDADTMFNWFKEKLKGYFE
jgi:hypothetical protein